MSTLSKSTLFTNENTVQRDWLLADADGQVLGRFAAEVAKRLQGKHKAAYTPNCDTGDYVVIVNADKIQATGKKLTDKIYYRHTNYNGGLKQTALGKMMQEKPERALELAIKGMLPKGPLGYAMYTKLKVYAGAEHPHSAQQPQSVSFAI